MPAWARGFLLRSVGTRSLVTVRVFLCACGLTAEALEAYGGSDVSSAR